MLSRAFIVEYCNLTYLLFKQFTITKTWMRGIFMKKKIVTVAIFLFGIIGLFAFIGSADIIYLIVSIACINSSIIFYIGPEKLENFLKNKFRNNLIKGDKIKMKQKWYLKTWFICFLFVFSFMIIPLIVGLVLLFMKENQESKLLRKYGYIDQLEETINTKKEEADKIILQANKTAESILEKNNHDIEVLSSTIASLEKEKERLELELNHLTKTITIETVEIFDYDHITSEECKNELALLKVSEKDLIKDNKALIISSTDTKKVLNNNIKQILRCFNSECSNIIKSVTAKNIEASRGKITRSFETLNSIFSTDGLKISKKLLEIKLVELNLVYTYELKKEEEREQQRAIKEQMVEEERLRREIEAEKKKIEKEEHQFKNEVNKLLTYLNKTTNDVEKNLYIEKIKELEEKLKQLEIDKENVFQREQNTRAGFVYVISNIGSFGENIYKIGMTRRLEPMDRIKELSSASVPFNFDVHAMIFSEDAPTLETILHQTFRDKEVNKVNPRKEFFKVTLQEIEEVVKKNHNATVQFTMIAEAEQYRESLRLSNTNIA